MTFHSRATFHLTTAPHHRNQQTQQPPSHLHQTANSNHQQRQKNRRERERESTLTATKSRPHTSQKPPATTCPNHTTTATKQPSPSPLLSPFPPLRANHPLCLSRMLSAATLNSTTKAQPAFTATRTPTRRQLDQAAANLPLLPAFTHLPLSLATAAAC